MEGAFMTKEEFMANYDLAVRDVDDHMDSIQETFRREQAHRRMLEAGREAYLKADRLNDEVERCQREIDDLNEQLEQCQRELDEQLEAKQAEMDAMCREKDAEIAELRQQLLETQKQHLVAENQHLEAEVKSKPLEIHNHFGAGSNSQVFNDKVTGRFEKARPKSKKLEIATPHSRREKLEKLEKKKNKKKQWKKIVRKIL